MTAPTAPAVSAPAPVSAPAAPVTPVQDSNPFASALDRVISKAPIPADNQNDIPTGGPPPAEALPTREQVMGAVPSAGSTADGTQVPAVEGATAVPETPAAPTGEVKVDDPDGEVVMTAERNADGTFKAQIDPTQKFDIKIKDKLTGETKTYSKNVPELLRLAKDGIAVQKSRDELGYYRANVPVWQTEHQTLTTTVQKLNEDLQAQMELNRELLTAPEDLVVKRREEFAQEMSPERELARLKQMLAEREKAERDAQERARQTSAQAQEQKVVTDFAQARLAPALAEIQQVVGNEQRVKEIIALELLPFQVNGKVPPQHLQALEAHLKGPLLQRLKEESAARSADPRIEAAEKARRDAEARSQLLVNSVGRQMSPVAGTNVGADLTKPVPPPKNVNDAIERIINKPIMATR